MQFWEFSYPNGNKGVAKIDQVEYDKLEAKHGDMMPRLRMKRIPDVPQPVLLGGSSVKDFTWTWYNQCLMQDRVLNLFEDQGFTGYKTHPVSAKWKRRPKNNMDKSTESSLVEIPKLWELIPIGWGGVAPEESGMHLIDIRLSDGRHTYSKYTNPSKLIDESQWDGSDFFILWPLPGRIFVTDRVAQYIKNENLKGSILTRVQDLLWPGGIGDDCRPGNLHYFLPEPRAKEIGEPLGIY